MKQVESEGLLLVANQRSDNIVVFDNGYKNIHRYRKSRILEIDPSSDEVVWEYMSEDFYSPTAGVQQPLADGFESGDLSAWSQG